MFVSFFLKGLSAVGGGGDLRTFLNVSEKGGGGGLSAGRGGVYTGGGGGGGDDELYGMPYSRCTIGIGLQLSNV